MDNAGVGVVVAIWDLLGLVFSMLMITDGVSGCDSACVQGGRAVGY